jgi:hypothetical protein
VAIRVDFRRCVRTGDVLEDKALTRGRRPRADLSGEMRLALDLRATAFDPNAVYGTIVATTLAISAGQFPIAQQAPTRLRLEKGRILIEQFDWTLPSGAVAASGAIGLGPATHSDMRVSGAMPLGLVDVVLPGRGAGRAAFDIRIAGPIDSPQHEGTIIHGRKPPPARGRVSPRMDQSASSPEDGHSHFTARSTAATSRSTGHHSTLNRTGIAADHHRENVFLGSAD